MPDIVQIGTSLMELAGGIANADDKLKLSQAAMALNQLAMENGKLMEENAELRTALAHRKALEFRDDSYYIIDEHGDEIGPVCPQCYQDKGLVFLLERANGGARCSVCKTRYAGSRYAVEGFRQQIF